MVSKTENRENIGILIVDDDIQLRTQIKYHLKRFGYSVVGTAENKNESIQKSRKLSPDLILMDVAMDTPEAGIDAAITIHKTQDIPIIFLTGRKGTDTIDKALGASPHGYLIKPIIPESLEATIELSLLRHQYEIELHNYQNALKESESLFRGIFGAMNNGYYRTDLDGIITLVNPALVKMLGFKSEKELMGHTFASLKVIDSKERKLFIEKLKQENQIKLFESTWRSSKGAGIHALEDAKIISDSDQSTFIEGSIQDISRLKILEDNLRHNQKMEVIAILGNRIAHEINNRLTSILGYSELSIMKLDGNVKLQKYLTSIKNNANDATEVIRHLLHFSKKQDQHQSMINVDEFLSKLNPIIQTLIWKNITINMGYSSERLYIQSNQDSLEQAIMNIIINSREAMPDGGELTITNSRLEITSSTSRTFGLPAGHFSEIKISDTGIGMNKDVITKIFEPFYTTKTESLSTGLGLSAVRDIVENHNGKILVDSEINIGSEFRIILPLHKFRENNS